MKIRNGFVSNSSSSSFIVRNKEKQVVMKELIDNCGFADYYELDNVLYTSFISDGRDEYVDFYKFSDGEIDGNHNSPYDENEFVEFEGERGVNSVWIEKEVIHNCQRNKFIEELKSLNNLQVNELLAKYKDVLTDFNVF